LYSIGDKLYPLDYITPFLSIKGSAAILHKTVVCRLFYCFEIFAFFKLFSSFVLYDKAGNRISGKSMALSG